jgi:hypothetical protein
MFKTHESSERSAIEWSAEGAIAFLARNRAIEKCPSAMLLGTLSGGPEFSSWRQLSPA